jgi:glycosyltransferase involved in cell wall biosynthesis
MYFTIITAIYNVEQHIDKGIKCILNQKFRDFEIILSDDGSTDNSSELCDKYARIDERVKVIHGPNAGAGEARNRALNIALGKYICFFDIDDYVTDNWLITIYKKIEQYKPQVLCYGFKEIDPFYHTSIPFRFQEKIYPTNEDIRLNYVSDLLGLNFNNGFLWNKVYERDFIENNHLRFENQRIQQDEVFNLLAYPKINRLVTVSDVLYDYYIYSSGNTRSRYIPDRLDIYQSVREHFLALYKNWPLNDERMLKYIYLRYFYSLLECINFNFYHPNAHYSSAERHKLLKQIITSDDIKECLYRMKQLNVVPPTGTNKQFYYALRDGDMTRYNRIRIKSYYAKFCKIKLRKFFNLILKS